MRLEELERELRAERPKVDPDFARKLDDWAAAGFPRGGELGPRHRTRGLGALPARRGAGSGSRFRPQRWLAPAGGLAALIALVVGISSLDMSGSSDDSADSGGATALQEQAPPPASTPTPDIGDAAGGGDEARALTAPAKAIPPAGARPDHGKIAQDVNLALATAPDDFRDTADGVLDVVDDNDGFVLESSVSGGDPDVEGAKPGRANFEIRIPAGQLQSAIAGLSDLGHVVSRTDGTQDITSRFNSAKRRIATYTQARDRLLQRLEDATTETEQNAIKAQLRIVEFQLDAAQRDLGSAQQRVHLVPVTVTVSADDSVSGGDGGWGIDDALDDAGKVLTVGAGVLVISAAVLLPLAILVALSLGIADRARHRAREQALDA
jgi:hypothetical protein